MLDPVSIFIYTWTFLDTLVTDNKIKNKKGLLYYRNIAIFLFPLISYVLYLAESLTYAHAIYENLHGTPTSLKVPNRLGGCLFTWNGFLILLSCIHLGILLVQVNRLTKRINAEYVDAETQYKTKLKMGTTTLHILTLMVLTFNTLETVYLDFGSQN